MSDDVFFFFPNKIKKKSANLLDLNISLHSKEGI